MEFNSFPRTQSWQVEREGLERVDREVDGGLNMRLKREKLDASLQFSLIERK